MYYLMGQRRLNTAGRTRLRLSAAWHSTRPASGLPNDTLPRFVDWLLDRVVMVGIRAFNRNHGFKIFESMNDRGARLTSVDLAGLRL
jgi:hypothetical protein